LTATGFLRKNGCEVFCREEDAEKIDVPVCRDLHTIDCFLIFGGDGTMLQSVKKYISYQKPFAGINTGTLGFLSDVEPQNTERALRDLLDGRYQEEKRSTLSVTVGEKKYTAVNEIGLQRVGGRVLTAEIIVDEKWHETVRADGVLVASSTGSTAYNLSAGGPILSPTSRSYVVTPVCAHSLTVRPVVLGENETVCLQVLGQAQAMLYLDGDNISLCEQAVKVTGSENTFTLLRLHDGNFFSVLRNKLSQ